MTLTAVVTAPPSELRRPALKPGETMMQFFIRNNPQEWKQEADRMAQALRLPPAMASALRNGNVDTVPQAQAAIHNFVNDYTPRPLRTLRGLSEFRKALEQLPPMRQFQFDVLYPRQGAASADMPPETLEKFGAKSVVVESSNGSFNLANILPEVQGDLLWIVPGGTKIVVTETVEKIERLMNYFDSNNTCALYQDGSYSMILRTSACKALACQGHAIPLAAEKLAPLVRGAGHKASRDQGQGNALCVLEAEFGGPAKPVEETPKSWWKSMFSK